MNWSAPGLEALSESEVELLAELLAGIKNEDALSLEGVGGLFCALRARDNVPYSAGDNLSWSTPHSSEVGPRFC